MDDVEVSPDGRWLVFDSDRGGNPDIYKMVTGGDEPIRLTVWVTELERPSQSRPLQQSRETGNTPR